MWIAEALYDSEDEEWYVGVRLGLPYGPWSQRNDSYCFESCLSEQDAQEKARRINSMTEEERRKLYPNFYRE